MLFILILFISFLKFLREFSEFAEKIENQARVGNNAEKFLNLRKKLREFENESVCGE